MEISWMGFKKGQANAADTEVEAIAYLLPKCGRRCRRMHACTPCLCANKLLTPILHIQGLFSLVCMQAIRRQATTSWFIFCSNPSFTNCPVS